MKVNLQRLGDNIRSLRTDGGYTQQDLAWMIGVKRQRISEWETGSAQLTLGNALFIAEALGTTLDTLTNGVLEMDDAKKR